MKKMWGKMWKKMGEMRKNRKRNGWENGAVILACILIAVLSAGAVSAYFTDGDTLTNTFTVGKISLELQEPGWIPENGEDMVPCQTVTKDPQIYNAGTNPEFVFLEVVLPYKNMVTANEDGTLNAPAHIQLYTYVVNEGWHQLSCLQNEGEDTITYVYAFGTETACTPLAVGSTTPPVFNEVTFANIVENQAMEGSSLSITVNAYGIQTTDINGGMTAPADVWAVLKNQLSPALEQMEAGE